MSLENRAEVKPFTGRRVLVIALSAFGVIIAANATLVYFAASNFSGLVAENSYVASQDWTRTRAAEEALGWDLEVDAAPEALRLVARDSAGEPLTDVVIVGRIGRPADAHTDAPLELAAAGPGVWTAPPLGPGAWRIEVALADSEGHVFERAYRRLGPRPPRSSLR